MDMKKILKILMVLVIIMLIIVCIILMLLARKEERSFTPATENDVIEIEETLKEVTVRNNYYAVKNCITKFYSYYSAIYSTESSMIEEMETQNIEAVYNILDEDYKKYKNITLENLKSQISPLGEVSVDIKNMYVTQRDENISIYFVKGYLIDTQSLDISTFSMIVNVDMLNRTYTIMMEDYMKEKYGNLKVDSNIQIDYDKKIENNKYNTFKFKVILDDEYIKDLVAELKNKMIYNISDAYDNLNEEYKTKKFPTLNAFKQYVNNKKKDIANMNVTKYQKNKYDDYTQYICLDRSGNTYIINETATMRYNVILDEYTIDIPQLVEKYNNSSEQNKVQTNIKKFMMGINNKDYNYSYNVLSDSFKQNKYQDVNKFEQYIKQNLFEDNNVEFLEFSQQGSNYMYKIKVINEENNEEIGMTIIMKLKEGTSFEMSFSIK